MKRVGIYVRSTQSDPFIREQVDKLQRFAETQPDWVVKGIYIDNGYKGTTESRPDYKRLRRDFQSGEIDLILVEQISRLAKKTAILDKLQKIAYRKKGRIYDLSQGTVLKYPDEMSENERMLYELVKAAGGAK